jgi:hypothetical protein
MNIPEEYQIEIKDTKINIKLKLLEFLLFLLFLTIVIGLSILVVELERIIQLLTNINNKVQTSGIRLY